MKKCFKSIISLFMVFLLSVGQLYAKEDSMQAEWRGDYTNMNLVLTVKAPVDYVQSVTVLMYPKGETPGFATYSRVDEVIVDGNTEKEILIKLANDLNAPNGEYTVALQGNGAYDAGKNSCTVDVSVMSPNDVSSLLNQINGVVGDTEDSLTALKGYMEKIAAILKLEGVNNAMFSQLKTIINIRNIDYITNGKTFGSLNDVENAWHAVSLIEFLAQSNISTTQLEDGYMKLSNKLSDKLSVDMTDDDYLNVKNVIYNNIISMRKLFNNGKGVLTIKDAENIFNQAKAVAVVNTSTVDKMETVVEKYMNVLGIDNTVYSSFSKYSTTDKQKILRYITEKNFLSAEAVKTAFITAVTGASSGGSGSNVGTNSGNHLASPGSLGGITSNNTVTVPQSPSLEGGFSDLNPSHWAYVYVNGLKNDGIISGYSDGNFYPNNAVKREEFVKMIILAAGMYSEGESYEFEDVRTGEWYYHYIVCASQSGVVNGVGEGIFGVGNSITREDVAVIVNRILITLNIHSDNSGNLSFSDKAQISGYAVESVENLSGIGILNGFEDGSFKPKANLTRAEAAKVIFVFSEYIKK